MRLSDTRAWRFPDKTLKAAGRASARPVASSAATSKPAPAQQSKQTASAVDAVVRYLKPPANGEQAYVYVYGNPPEGQPASNFEGVEHTVPVTDLHSVPQDFTLERNGFQLHRLQVPVGINWENEQEVQSRYYPLAEKLLLEVTGGSRVHIFDHTLRTGKILQTKSSSQVQIDKPNEPVPLVHIDYTATSGVQRLDALLPEEADRLRETPFAVIQVWRPLRGPVQDSPLGLIDASTVAKEDLVEYAIHFPGRTGHNYGVQHNSKHEWYFAKGMTAEEAYVFVCYDSREDRARFTPHTGFTDPTAPPDAPPRESIELRSYVFWEHEPKQPYATQL